MLRTSLFDSLLPRGQCENFPLNQYEQYDCYFSRIVWPKRLYAPWRSSCSFWGLHVGRILWNSSYKYQKPCCVKSIYQNYPCITAIRNESQSMAGSLRKRFTLTTRLNCGVSTHRLCEQNGVKRDIHPTFRPIPSSCLQPRVNQSIYIWPYIYFESTSQVVDLPNVRLRFNRHCRRRKS